MASSLRRWRPPSWLRLTMNGAFSSPSLIKRVRRWWACSLTISSSRTTAGLAKLSTSQPRRIRWPSCSTRAAPPALIFEPFNLLRDSSSTFYHLGHSPCIPAEAPALASKISLQTEPAFCEPSRTPLRLQTHRRTLSRPFVAHPGSWHRSRRRSRGSSSSLRAVRDGPPDDSTSVGGTAGERQHSQCG